MAQLAKLKARVRSEFGKGPMGRMRKMGRVPGVVYRGGRDPVALDIGAEELGHMVHGAASEHILVSLAVEGEAEARSVLIQEIQRNVLTDALLHIDFQEVSLTEKLRAPVPVEPHGEVAGVKAGGTLEQIMHEIEVECLPTDLPGVIDVDVSALEVGDALHVRDLAAPEGVVFVPDPDLVVFTVAPPRVAEVEEAPVEGEAAEPELAGEAGADEGEGEGA